MGLPVVQQGGGVIRGCLVWCVVEFGGCQLLEVPRVLWLLHGHRPINIWGIIAQLEEIN